MTVTHLNPATLHRNPAFSPGTIAPAGRMLYVGEQYGTDATGRTTGGLDEQTAQALRKVLAVLEEGGASIEDVVKLTIHPVESADANEAYRASAEVWGMHPTAVTVLKLPALGRPEALVGVEAIAALG